MDEKNQLLLGIDLGKQASQITCFDRTEYEAVPLGREINGEMVYEFPMALKWLKASGTWRFPDQEGDGGEEIILDHLLERFQKTSFEAGGHTFQTEMVLERYLLKLLSAVTQQFPEQRIKHLVITVHDKTPELTKLLHQIGKKLNLYPERMSIQNYRLSYMYYAVSQPKELWLNNVGLFLFNKEELLYSQITVDRRTIPWIVGVTTQNLTNVFDYSMLEEESVDAQYAFVNIAETAMHKQAVTTLYAQGDAFDGEWAKEALQKLCNGRRVFRGNNIFTKGACYAARELSGEGKLDQCILLDEDMITANVSLRVYHEAQMQDVVLAKAGSLWEEVDASVDVIPDKEYEIQIAVQDVIKHQTKIHMLSLSGFQGRENKTTRFTVRVRFSNRETAVITLKDNGFGEISPTSNRIWERCICL